LPATVTKTTQYEISRIITPVTKTAAYKILRTLSSPITKVATYDILRITSATTKSAVYVISRVTSPVTKIAAYKVKGTGGAGGGGGPGDFSGRIAVPAQYTVTPLAGGIFTTTVTTTTTYKIKVWGTGTGGSKVIQVSANYGIRPINRDYYWYEQSWISKDRVWNLRQTGTKDRAFRR
jgi:hypothetical protein